MAVFEGKKSSNDIIINGTLRNDEVVASDVPQQYLFFSFTLLKRKSPSHDTPAVLSLKEFWESSGKPIG